MFGSHDFSDGERRAMDASTREGFRFAKRENTVFVVFPRRSHTVFSGTCMFPMIDSWVTILVLFFAQCHASLHTDCSCDSHVSFHSVLQVS